MRTQNEARLEPIFRWLAAAVVLLGGVTAGCGQQAPPTDPAARDRELKELEKQHQREMQNK